MYIMNKNRIIINAGYYKKINKISKALVKQINEEFSDIVELNPKFEKHYKKFDPHMYINNEERKQNKGKEKTK